MKTLILTSVLPFLACAALAQDTPPVKEAPAETVKKAHPAAWLGIELADSDGKVVIGRVAAGSPAAKAGLQSGDLLLKIGDTAVEGQIQRVLKTVGNQKPGDAVELQLRRGDKDLVIRTELAERPAQLDGDFQGEFRKVEEKTDKALKDPVKKQGKGVKEANRDIEQVKEEMKKADQSDLKFKKMEYLKGTAENPKKKFEGKIELDPFKNADGEKLFRYYLDKKWPEEKAGDKWGKPELRLRFDVPPSEWKNGKKPEVRYMEMKTKGNAAGEADVWKRVQESIAHSLKRSEIGPDVVEKVMKAVEEARLAGSEKDARRAKLEAEAARLEKEMQSLKERSEKLREELKNAE